MSHYVAELIIWILLAYAIGCIIGWLLRSMSGDTAVEPSRMQASEPAARPVEPVAAPAAQLPIAPIAPVLPAEAVAPAPLPPKPMEHEVLAPVPPSAVPGLMRMERPKGIEAPRAGGADALQMISGVGPKNEQVLHNLGFYHFDQIASWTPQQVAWVDDHLKFGGRIVREEWIAQAKLLAAGDLAEFRKRYDTGGMNEEDFAKALARKNGNSQASKTESPIPAEPVASLAAIPAASGARSKPQGIEGPRGGKPDNLQRISGVGPKNEKILHGLGIFHFDQIANWTRHEIAWVDEHLKFNGRIEREEWVTQCRLLAAGKEEEFAKRWGTGGLKPDKK